MNYDIEYISAQNITAQKEKTSMKCYGYWIMDDVDRFPNNFLNKIFSGINKFGFRYRRGFYYNKKNRIKMDVYWGWAQFALTRKCVQYILDVYNNDNCYNNYMRHLFPPDELYF